MNKHLAVTDTRWRKTLRTTANRTYSAYRKYSIYLTNITLRVSSSPESLSSPFNQKAETFMVPHTSSSSCRESQRKYAKSHNDYRRQQINML